MTAEWLEHRLLAREGRRALWLERFDRVKALQHEGRSLTAIAKETSLNWRTVAKWTELRELPERRSMNPKSTTPRKYETYLAQRWAEGFRTGRHLLPEIKKLGYTGSLTHLERLLSEWRRSGRGPCLASLDPDAGNRSSLAAMPVPPIAASYLCLKPRGLMTRQELATTTELKRAAPLSRPSDKWRCDFVGSCTAEIRTSLSHGWTMLTDRACTDSVDSPTPFAMTLQLSGMPLRSAGVMGKPRGKSIGSKL